MGKIVRMILLLVLAFAVISAFLELKKNAGGYNMNNVNTGEMNLKGATR